MESALTGRLPSFRRGAFDDPRLDSKRVKLGREACCRLEGIRKSWQNRKHDENYAREHAAEAKKLWEIIVPLYEELNQQVTWSEQAS